MGGSGKGKPCSITQRLTGNDICVGGFVCNWYTDRSCYSTLHCQECQAAGCLDTCSSNCNGDVYLRITFPNTCPRQTQTPRCSVISGSYIRSFDKAMFTVSQYGCT